MTSKWDQLSPERQKQSAFDFYSNPMFKFLLKEHRMVLVDRMLHEETAEKREAARQQYLALDLIAGRVLEIAQVSVEENELE